MAAATSSDITSYLHVIDANEVSSKVHLVPMDIDSSFIKVKSEQQNAEITLVDIYSGTHYSIQPMLIRWN